jgi:hypothetical protein
MPIRQRNRDTIIKYISTGICDKLQKAEVSEGGVQNAECGKEKSE